MSTSSPPVVVAAALDDGFALPVSVMLASLVENLGIGVELEVFLLEDRVPEPTRRRIEASVARDSVTLTWISPGSSILADVLPRGDHPVVPASYYRLLLPELLPNTVDRVVYLDGDLVVLADVAELFGLDMDGNLALAVRDSYARSFHLSRLTRLRIDELPTFDADSSYFNSGVMLIDLAGWREHGIGAQAVHWVSKYTRELRFYDQDALNCALHGRWGSLDVAWNFHELPALTRHWDADQYDREELRRAFRKPKIVHFTSSPKPWHPDCRSVHSHLFFEYLASTSWKDWRLPPVSRARRWRNSLIRQPHTRFEWLFWRGAFQSRDPLLLWRAMGVLARHPWLVLTYPLSRARRIAGLLRRATSRLFAPVAGPRPAAGAEA